MYEDTHTEKLKKIYEKKVNNQIEVIRILSEVTAYAEMGDIDAMYHCYRINMMIEYDKYGTNSRRGEAYEWLVKAAENGHIMAIKTYGLLYLYGYLPNTGYDIDPKPEKALEICDLFKEEDLGKEEVQEFIKDIKNEVKKKTNNTSDSNTSEGCYIATAVYGDYDAPEVRVLRKFRDSILLQHWWGKLFVRFYYFVSPPLADKLRDAKGINMKVKKILDCFVRRLNK